MTQFRFIDHADGEKNHEKEQSDGSQVESGTGNAFVKKWLVWSKGKEKRFCPCLLESL